MPYMTLYVQYIVKSGGCTLEDINAVLAENLRRMRENRRLSLDAVARLTGVSKSMLGQIERGEVNPTVSTMWKIAGGLKVNFTALFQREQERAEELDIGSITPLLEDEGRYRDFPLFTTGDGRPFEILYIEIDPGSGLEAEPHPEGTQEFITVHSGAVEVYVDGETHCAAPNRALRFTADRPHGYKNPSNDVCRMTMVIFYPES